MADDKKRANILGLVEAAWGQEASYVKSPSAADVGGIAGGKSTSYRKTTPTAPPRRKP